MPRTSKIAAKLVLAILIVATLSAAPVAARDPLTPRDFPGVKRVATVFPGVTSREMDSGDGGSPAYLPHCALDGVSEIADSASEARRWFWAAYSGETRGVLGGMAEAFRFANPRQASRSMRIAMKVLSKCSGLQIGSESYSRYREFAVPALGDERFGYVGGYEYDFEPGFRGSREILVRTGRDILVVSAGRAHRQGSKAAGVTKTVKFARLVLHKNPLS